MGWVTEEQGKERRRGRKVGCASLPHAAEKEAHITTGKAVGMKEL